MEFNLENSLTAWNDELRSGASTETVLASMASVLADYLYAELRDYVPDESDLNEILEIASEEKRNPMAELGEEIAIFLNGSHHDEVFGAIETLESYQEMVEEFDDGTDEDEEPDVAMMAGDAIVEQAVSVLQQTWEARRGVANALPMSN